MEVNFTGLEDLHSFIKTYDQGQLDLTEIQKQLFYQGDKIGHCIAQVADTTDENSYEIIGRFFASLLSNGVTKKFWGLSGLINKLYLARCHQQKKLNKPLHKGLVLHNEGLIQYGNGNRELGIKHITLAVIEDIIHGGTDFARRSNALRFLATESYNENTADNIFNELVERVKNMQKEGMKIWYPEEVLNIRDHIEVLPGDAYKMFSFNIVQYEELLNDLVGDATGTNLEVLVKHLFSGILGLQFIGQRILTRSAEIDLAFRIFESSNPLFEMFGHYVIIECKDWEKPVNSQIIRSFTGNLQSLNVNGGVLIAKNGITGASYEERAYAILEIVKAYHRHGITIIVLTLEDLRRMARGENLVNVLLKRYEKIRFDIK